MSDNLSAARQAAGRIKRAKGTKKDHLYLSFFGKEREDNLKAIILGLPPRAYTLKTRECGHSLSKAVGEIAGVYAETDVTQRFMRGLSVEFPERINVSFTLGLDEVRILPKRKSVR